MFAEVKTGSQFLKDRENQKCLDLTDHGTCTQCGACCTNFLPMNEKEIRRIHTYIKKNHVPERKTFIPTKNKTIDFTCPFLDDQKEKEKCRIYPVRPGICRQFICCPEKRKMFVPEKGQNYKAVDVRKEFYGGKE